MSRNKYRVEKSYPTVIGLIVGVTFFFLLHFNVLPSLLKNVIVPGAFKGLFSSFMTISSIAIGFLAGALSLLVALSNKPLMESLKKLGFYDRVIKYMTFPLSLSFILAFLSAGLSIVKLSPRTLLCDLILSIWILLATIVVLAAYRATRILVKILKNS